MAIGDPEDDADLRKTLGSLSKATMARFNADWPDPVDVPLYSFAGLTGVLATGEPFCAMGERRGPRRGDLLEPADGHLCSRRWFQHAQRWSHPGRRLYPGPILGLLARGSLGPSRPSIGFNRPI